MVVTLSTGKWVAAAAAAAPPGGASASIFQWNTAFGKEVSPSFQNPANYLVIIRDARVELILSNYFPSYGKRYHEDRIQKSLYIMKNLNSYAFAIVGRRLFVYKSLQI